MTRIAALGFLLVFSCSALARECGEGRVGGGLSQTGDALQDYDCAMLARIYCRLGEDRDAGLGPEEATRETNEWLQRLDRTGSHLKGHFEPIIAIGAREVFRAKERPPGTLYYRAAYACGVSKRVADADAAARQSAGKAFDAAAGRCEREHPPARRSYPNQPLRECLAGAVEGIAARPPAKK
jgi:hypothetical protein